MRQQQNNKNRMRNRGRNKPGNNINRNYESNGPDVKIRGNASHIAEKYTMLARDALSSGDTVIAENYLQHAEHYNRIILAAQAQREEAQASRMRAAAEQDEQPDVSGAGEDGEAVQEEAAPARRRRNASGDEKPSRRRSSKSEEKAAASSDEAQSEGPAENGEIVANGADHGDELEAKPKKRPTRTRRPSRRKAEPVEGMSEDAAALPQGLLGGSPVGENVGAEE